MAMFLSDIKATSFRETLRKTETKEKRLTPSELFSTEPKAGSDEILRDYFFQAGVDKWYNNLESSTFRSEFVSLSSSEAKEIIDHWKKYTTSHNGDGDLEDDFAPTNTDTVPKSLKTLITQIDETIRNRFGTDTPADGKVFIKLSTRSPKDSKTIFEIAKKRYNESPPQNKFSLSLNERLCLFSELILRSCCVKSGLEAAVVLLDSQRVAEDLREAFDWKKGELQYDLSVVVRGWDSRIQPKCEFRGFVIDRTLTCVGQYWHHLYFPELDSVKEQISHDCLTFFETLKDSLPVPDAMLDLAWFGPGDMLLIEVNPLANGLGSFKGSTGLFDYEEDVLRGKKPFEIRICKEEPTKEQLQVIMSSNWRKLLIGKHES